MSYYLIYRITNTINGKFYIGKHVTCDLNDDYMGSGTWLKRAIKKYGVDNFQKEILEVYDVEWKMNLAERILVVLDRDISYNITTGGGGSFSYINTNKLQNTDKATIIRRENGTNTMRLLSKRHHDKLQNDPVYRERVVLKIKDGISKPGGHPWRGKHLPEAMKQNMRKSKNVGVNNSQHGTIWITNGSNNRKIKNNEMLPTGWVKGRKI
jgi:group I intron endonuclease